MTTETDPTEREHKHTHTHDLHHLKIIIILINSISPNKL